jgi:hypothetical protein
MIELIAVAFVAFIAGAQSALLLAYAYYHQTNLTK